MLALVLMGDFKRLADSPAWLAFLYLRRGAALVDSVWRACIRNNRCCRSFGEFRQRRKRGSVVRCYPHPWRLSGSRVHFPGLLDKSAPRKAADSRSVAVAPSAALQMVDVHFFASFCSKLASRARPQAATQQCVGPRCIRSIEPLCRPSCHTTRTEQRGY